MTRFLLIIVAATACKSSEERSRQAAELRQDRESLLTADVVKALQPPAPVGRLIYDRPFDLSYDSLRVKRPDLVRAAAGRNR